MSDLIQPVICDPEAAHPGRVQKLVEYIRNLDGTEVKVIKVSKAEDAEFIKNHPVNSFYSMQAYSLRREALLMKGKPFIHLEPDSIPLKPGWVKALSEEYYCLGKHYMMSTDSHPPGDLVSGIGVYGPNTSTEIPYEFDRSSWDLWMIQNIPEKIARSSLIQHKYGIYDDNGIHKTRNITFPRDKDLLRAGAVIFHADPTQSLLRKPGHLRFAHSGCLGDAIAALPIIRQLGGGDLIMTQVNNPRILRGWRYESLRPLLESQPYVHSVSWEENPSAIDYDFTDFRKIYASDRSLTETQGRYLGVNKIDYSPWLKVEPSPISKGMVVVSRTTRYRNPYFIWSKLVRVYKDKILFVGLEDEYREFQKLSLWPIKYQPCKNLLELAQVITGSSLLISNQTVAGWIGMGLGHPLIQESCPGKADSIIPRPNAQFVQYNTFSFPPV